MTGENSAGSSARREYERRRAKDEARIRADWGPLGSLAVALSSERQSTRAWNTGALGEERIGGVLNAMQSDRLAVLHDRRIPGSRANIDHLVVNSGGVWVIDTKRYKGRPERRVEGGLFRPRVELLYVGGRNKTTLVEGVQWQVEKVQDALGDVPVGGILCFVDAEWGFFDGPFSVDGVDVMWPKKLGSRMTAGPTGSVDVPAVAAALAATFRAA
jgi:hypothetical protein